MAFKINNDTVIHNDKLGDLANLNVDTTSVLVGDTSGNVTLQNVIIDASTVDVSTFTTDDIDEGTNNLYYTDDRAQAVSINAVQEDTAPVLGANLNANNFRITNLSDPIDVTDAATVSYVDSAVSSGTGALTTDDIPEGLSNFYYSDTLARGAISVTGSGTYTPATGVIDIQGGVTSVNTQTGDVVLTTTEITEGSNLYYTTARANDDFDTRLTTKTTDNLTEGANLYYTDARANSAIDNRVDTAFIDALNVTAASVQANSVALGTDTTGNYVATITGTSDEIDVTGSGNETASVTISLPNNMVVPQNLTVTGNLTVNGTTFTNDTETLSVDDPYITVGGDTPPTSDDNKDRGVRFRWYDTEARLGFFGFDDNTGCFTFIPDATETGEVFSGTKGCLTVGSVIVDNTVTGDLIGNADTATALETARTITLSGDVSGSVSFDGTSNVTINSTIQPNSVEMGVDTYGPFVKNMSVGAGLTISGNTGLESQVITVSHADTSSQASVNNSDGTIIQDITLDDFGHITAISSLNLDNRYYTETEANALLADKLDANHDITLTFDGDVTGTGTITNMGDTTLNVFVANDSHTHDGRYYTEAEADARFLNSSGDTMTGNFRFSDTGKAYFGDGDDLRVFHNGSDSFVKNLTNALFVQSDTLFLQSNTGETYLSGTLDGATEIRYNNATKLETTNTGVNITGELVATGDVTAYSTSDERLKTKLKLIDNPLLKLSKINGYTFNWVEGSGKDTSRRESGVLAQEVEMALPETVVERENGYKAVRYEQLIPLLVEAIKDQQQQISDLKQELKSLKDK